MLWLRFPIQALFILWAYWYTTDRPRARSDAGRLDDRDGGVTALAGCFDGRARLHVCAAAAATPGTGCLSRPAISGRLLAVATEEIGAQRPADRAAGVLRDHQPPQRSIGLAPRRGDGQAALDPHRGRPAAGTRCRRRSSGRARAPRRRFRPGPSSSSLRKKTNDGLRCMIVGRLAGMARRARRGSTAWSRPRARARRARPARGRSRRRGDRSAPRSRRAAACHRRARRGPSPGCGGRTRRSDRRPTPARDRDRRALPARRRRGRRTAPAGRRARRRPAARPRSSSRNAPRSIVDQLGRPQVERHREPLGAAQAAVEQRLVVAGERDPGRDRGRASDHGRSSLGERLRRSAAAIGRRRRSLTHALPVRRRAGHAAVAVVAAASRASRAGRAPSAAAKPSSESLVPALEVGRTRPARAPASAVRRRRAAGCRSRPSARRRDRARARAGSTSGRGEQDRQQSEAANSSAPLASRERPGRAGELRLAVASPCLAPIGRRRTAPLPAPRHAREPMRLPSASRRSASASVRSNCSCAERRSQRSAPCGCAAISRASASAVRARLAARRQPIGEPDRERLFGADGASGKQQIERAGKTDQAWQPHRGAVAIGTPTRREKTPKTAVSSITRRSHHRASPRPPAQAAPSIAAITGLARILAVGPSALAAHGS